jgi:Carboxypeptidase regulatory-like domain
MTRKFIWLSFFLTALCAQFAASQSKRDGAINGRILRDDGRPAAGVEVSLRRKIDSRGSERTVTSDEEGSFRFTNLAPGVYAIEAQIPGYIVEGASLSANVYRTGEQATIRLTKGGVITGRVTDETGEPLVRLPVLASRVRRVEAQSAGSSTPDSALDMPGKGIEELGWTDDRGVYRIYGLPPGVYVVGIGDAFVGAIDSPQLGRDAPTYYPSAPRDVAEEITLRGAEEVSGIDIRHRG